MVSNFLKNLRSLSRQRNAFFCFSPPVMIATFIIELILAAYTFIRYKTNRFIRAGLGLILLLSAFQLAEYQICAGTDAAIWAKIGFAAITILPILGLYLTYLAVQSRSSLYFLTLGIIVSAGFIFFFFTSPQSITGALCGGNYVIFRAAPVFYLYYSLYYFFFLGAAIFENMIEASRPRNNHHKKETLAWLMTGYASFLLPMAVVYLIYPETEAAIPSIMCGFAILFAFILVFKVFPNYHKSRP